MELRGRSILITRAASQSAELRAGLESLGARVLECPAIEILPVEDWTLVDNAIARLNSYNWLLFTSTNAVDYFMRRVETLGAACNVPIAAVGAVTANQLRMWRHTATLVPEDFRAEGLLQAFPEDMSGMRILFPRAEAAREVLPEELQRRRATVDLLTVYRTVKAPGLDRLPEILAQEKIDCVVFTSPSAIRFTAETLGSGIPSLFHNVAVAVIGPIAREAAEAAGLRVAIEPAQATVPDMIRSISTHFAGEGH